MTVNNSLKKNRIEIEVLPKNENIIDAMQKNVLRMQQMKELRK
jgi:hypothetical protein